MKTSKLLVLIACIMLTGTISAQQFSGKVVYIEDFTKKMKEVIGSNEAQLNQLPPEQRLAITQAMEKKAKREMELRFNSDASVYAAPEEIEVNASQDAMNVNVKLEGTMAYYCNIKTGKTITQQILSDREFLVEDNVKTYEWQLHPETKTIGNFRANKATTIVEDSATITAWYTTEIPVSLGPQRYNGLPGLILEMNSKDSQVLFKDIVLNSTYMAVNPPKKGKKVSKEEFEKIDQKLKTESEMTILKNEE